ncbi:MAG: hypothetical protein HFI35_15770 [Roseburia sp.]|nr:hypothetical protein [Roseburia sp.]
MRKIYLVDSENVGDVWVPLLVSSQSDDRVLVFYTQKSPHMNYENVRMLKETEKEAVFIKCFEGSNALDFQLVTELGYRLREDADCEYVIVSNDTGFDAAVRYWAARRQPVSRLSGKECFRQLTNKKRRDPKREDDILGQTEVSDEQPAAASPVTGGQSSASKASVVTASGEEPKAVSETDGAGRATAASPVTGGQSSASKAAAATAPGEKPATAAGQEPEGSVVVQGGAAGASEEPAVTQRSEPSAMPEEEVVGKSGSEPEAAVKKPGSKTEIAGKPGSEPEPAGETVPSEDPEPETGLTGTKKSSGESESVVPPDKPSAMPEEESIVRKPESESEPAGKPGEEPESSVPPEMRADVILKPETTDDREKESDSAKIHGKDEGAEQPASGKTGRKRTKKTSGKTGQTNPADESAQTGQTNPADESAQTKQSGPDKPALDGMTRHSEDERSKSAVAESVDIREDVTKKLFCCISRENLVDFHNALVAFLGEEEGKELYQEVKGSTECAACWTASLKSSQKERFEVYCQLVFSHSEYTDEAPEDFAEFLYQANGKRKNLNSLRAALQSRYGKDKGMKYYSLFRPHIKIMNRM